MTLCTSARTVYALVRVCVHVHMAVSGGSDAADGEWLAMALLASAVADG